MLASSKRLIERLPIPDLPYWLALALALWGLHWYVQAGVAGNPAAATVSEIMVALLALVCVLAAGIELATWLYLVRNPSPLPGRGLPLFSAAALLGFGGVYLANLTGRVEIGPLTPFLFRSLLLVLVVVFAIRGVLILAIIAYEDRKRAGEP